MKRVAFGALMAVLALSLNSIAVDKAPAKLISEFAAVLPAGNMAKVAWAQSNAAGGKLIIHVVSSVDGIIREVSPGTSSAGNPQVTADGSKVIYQNYDQGQLWVVNWDGTGGKSFYTTGSSLQDYWHDGAKNIDWAVTYECEINAATGAKGRTWPTNHGDDGLHISPDGLYLASDFDSWAVYNLSTGVTTKRGSGGCVCNLSPDTKYSVMVQQSGHSQEGVTTASGTFTKYSVTADLIAKSAKQSGCSGAEGTEFQETRWPHPDFITFPVGGLLPNPFLVNLYTPTKWVAMQDDAGCLVPQSFMCSSVGARILPNVGINESRKLAQQSVKAQLRANDLVGESFLLDGRRINPKAQSAGSAVRGVVIRRVQGEAAAVRTVVMPK